MDLLTLLKAAKPGDTIKLPSGTYSSQWLDDVHFSPPVVITSADPANPAILTNFNTGSDKGVSGLTFQGLAFQMVTPCTAAFNVYNAKAVTFDRNHFYGPPGAPVQQGSMLNIFDSDGVTLTNNEGEQADHLFSIARSSNVVVSGNNLHHVNSDTLDFVQVTNVVVSGNALHDFHPTDGNHPDAMQFGTPNSTKSSQNVTISDNLIYRGEGENAQGVWISDDMGGMPFLDFTISGNLVIGTGASAIRPTATIGLTLIGNELVTVEGGDPTVMLVQDSDKVTAIHNSAVSISIEAKNGNTSITQNGNGITLPVSQAVADAKVAAWLAAHPGPWSAVAPVPAPPAVPPPPPVPVPPPVPPPVKVDPRDAQIASLKVQVASLKAKIAAGKAALS